MVYSVTAFLTTSAPAVANAKFATRNRKLSRTSRVVSTIEAGRKEQGWWQDFLELLDDEREGK
jgi:hypothetical protein